MNFDLKCEGFSPDESLEEEILLECRRVVIETGNGQPVRVMIRQVEGRVQAKVEAALFGRRVSVVVWRQEPAEAMKCAAEATVEVIRQSVSTPSNEPWKNSEEILSIRQ